MYSCGPPQRRWMIGRRGEREGQGYPCWPHDMMMMMISSNYYSLRTNWMNFKAFFSWRINNTLPFVNASYIFFNSDVFIQFTRYTFGRGFSEHDWENMHTSIFTHVCNLASRNKRIYCSDYFTYVVRSHEFITNHHHEFKLTSGVSVGYSHRVTLCGTFPPARWLDLLELLKLSILITNYVLTAEDVEYVDWTSAKG